MQRRDRRLNLIGPAAAMPHRLVDQRQPLRDHLLIPQRAVLVVEQHQRAAGVETGRRAGMLQQQQRRQAHDLGLALEQSQQ